MYIYSATMRGFFPETKDLDEIFSGIKFTTLIVQGNCLLMH